ncbi:LysR family transcriptional regulator [Acidovorax sp. SUPP3434]|uniref:LysR family transcriptional regulator n=1 Tax=Acidovorax sp. SUPP3434 TaxID=2920880 RepID=UPI0023DE260A|nr:LysR family transcriptional regulator [Acidovorax sp. SUPP3434]GKT02099.1 LysR family transcriptional regulator [Acidovorax sp. SUPP3434]
MSGNDFKDLTAFLMVAEESSFTRAAARLGLSQSALSQTIRGLEARLELRLFWRTTRSVSLTEAGERLLSRIGPAVSEIHSGLAELGEMNKRPVGTIRLTADEYAVHSVLQPAIAHFLPAYPGIRVEVTTDYGLTDIVSGRYDAGVRRGGLIAEDMIAVRIGPDVPMAVVGSPSYFARHTPPKGPHDLVAQDCLNLRLPTHGELFAWSFMKAGKEHRVKVDGPAVFNSIAPIRDAALSGLGLAYLPEAYVRGLIAAGQLVEVLSTWRRTFEGYHLYYANRRHSSAAFLLLVEALRCKNQ